MTWSTPEKTKAPVAAEAFKGKTETQLTAVSVPKNLSGTGHFQTFGQPLIDNGYLVIPIKPSHKRPAMDGWQHARLTGHDLNKYPGHGVGILCGQGAQPIAAIDIDTTHGELAERFTAWCQDNLGATCERVGNAPKILLVYRAAAEGWGKATGAWFEDSSGGRHRLEVLGNGQQFVAYHIHPDTGRPYEWIDLFGGIEAMRASALPVVSLDQVEEALQVFEQMAEDVGLVRISSGRNKVTHKAAAPQDDPLMAYEPQVGLSPTQIAAALDVLDPNMPHDDWLNVGMALHHETAGEGFDYWNAWSEKGSSYPGDANLRYRWDSFGRASGRPVTARYLLKLANENGASIALDLGSAEDFEAIADDDKQAEKLRFRMVPAGEFSRGTPPGWIIKGILPRAELVVLFGESGAGKSFVAVDMAGAIARGIAWRGNRTKAGRVAYIAAEGGGGVRNRLRAYELHHGIDLGALPFGVIHATPNFLQKTDAVDVCKAIIAAGGADVVIVDTFAQVIPGANENAADDMGKALAHCRGIHRATGAVVVLVHHAGKDSSKGARGWSGLRAAADAEIEVSRHPVGRMVRISKQKDGDDGGKWGFDLEPVAIGEDEDGDVVTSCIVKEAELPVTGKVGSQVQRPLGKWERLVQDVVGEIAIGQNSGIEVDHVLAEVVRRAPAAEPGKRDTRKQHARRALLALCEGDDAPYFMEGDCLEVL